MATEREPLPIWFFVGLILVVFGAVVLGAGLMVDTPERVVRVTALSPSVWWGGCMIGAGALFLAAGLRREGPGQPRK